jgi:hypothetical protein
MPAPLTEEGHYTLRRENKKKSTRKRNFKYKQTRSVLGGTSDLCNGTKKRTLNSRAAV